MGTQLTIIDAAKKLFVKNGYEGTTVRQICEAAGVSVSAINYHFNNKEGLFKAILQLSNKKHFDVGMEALETPESAEGFKIRLRFFIDANIATYLEDPDVYVLVMREYEKQTPELKSYFKDRSMNVYKKLFHFIEEAKYHGVLNPDINSGLLAGLVFNQITSQIRMNDYASEHFGLDLKDPSFKKAWINETINIIFNGAASGSSQLEVAKASGES